MRAISLAALALAVAVPAVAQDADRTVSGGGQLAPRWMARTDRGQNFDAKLESEFRTLSVSEIAQKLARSYHSLATHTGRGAGGADREVAVVMCRADGR